MIGEVGLAHGVNDIVARFGNPLDIPLRVRDEAITKIGNAEGRHRLERLPVVFKLEGEPIVFLLQELHDFLKAVF